MEHSDTLTKLYVEITTRCNLDCAMCVRRAWREPIGEMPLGEIWEGQPFSDFRQRLRDFHFSPCTTCGGCERFPANYVDCIGNTFPTCDGCLWAQGFVQCA